MNRGFTKLQSGLGLATAILTFAGAVAGATLWISKKFAVEDLRMQKIEEAIKVLNANQTDAKFQELVKELLAQRNANSAEVASPHYFGAQPLSPGIAADQAPASQPKKD
jgi:hypothetical protein